MKCPDDLIKLKTYSKPNPKQDYSNDNLKLKIQ